VKQIAQSLPANTWVNNFSELGMFIVSRALYTSTALKYAPEREQSRTHNSTAHDVTTHSHGDDRIRHCLQAGEKRVEDAGISR